jgi:membrane protease YdiL (CAAX protease family)
MYHRLARTERYRWWKPILELVLCSLFVCLLWIVAVVPLFIVVGPQEDGAAGLIVLGAAIAVLLPAAFLAARIARGRWRTLLSVDGHLRWRWFALCLAVALAEGVLSAGAEALFSALGSPLGATRGEWVGWARFVPLAVTVVVAIVPQAAAEEVVFRGTLLQALGAWVHPTWFPILLSSVAFGLMHGLSLPLFVATATLGLVCAWLTIRTGGLEAAVALHVLHNVSFFLAEAATGGSDRWITEINVDVRWSATVVDVALVGLYGLAIARLHSQRVLALRGAPNGDEGGPGSRSREAEPAEPDDLQLGERRHDHRLHQDEGDAEQAGIDPAGEKQGDAVHRPDRVAGDDRPDRAARQDLTAGEHRHEGRVG